MCLSPDEVSLVELAGRANAGFEISRSMLARLVVTPATAAATNPDRAPCISRVLAAPVLDSRELRPFGGPERIELAGQARKQLRFRHGPFDDAVVLHTGAARIATFYLFVHREILGSRIVVVAATDADDTVLNQEILDSSFMLPPQVFPARWTDPAGPWFEETAHVAQHQRTLQQRGFVGVLVKIKGHEKADRFQIGLLPQSADWHRKHMDRPFYVAAVEVLTAAEVLRSDYDTKEQKSKQGVLEAALGDSSSGQALLKPDTAYAVKVSVRRAARQAARRAKPVKDIVSVAQPAPDLLVLHRQPGAAPPRPLDDVQHARGQRARLLRRGAGAHCLQQPGRRPRLRRLRQTAAGPAARGVVPAPAAAHRQVPHPFR